MEDFTDLQRLLRLKSHEAPPADFMEDFLLEFHQRQRAEMLKRPLWRLALDRMEGALSSFQVPRYAYAGACGVALLVAGASANRILATTPGATTGLVASTGMAAGPNSGDANHFHPPAPQAIVRTPRLDIYSPRPSLSLAELDFDKPRAFTASPALPARNPRYVLDTRPVSYEQADSF